MDNCNHQRIANSGSNDKPYGYCWKYIVLKLRYRCNFCILKSCRFCLMEKNQLPSEGSILLDRRPNRYQTIEYRIISLENIINELTKKIIKLEDIVNKISKVVERLE